MHRNIFSSSRVQLSSPSIFSKTNARGSPPYRHLISWFTAPLMSCQQHEPSMQPPKATVSPSFPTSLFWLCQRPSAPSRRHRRGSPSAAAASPFHARRATPSEEVPHPLTIQPSFCFSRLQAIFLSSFQIPFFFFFSCPSSRSIYCSVYYFFSSLSSLHHSFSSLFSSLSHCRSFTPSPRFAPEPFFSSPRLSHAPLHIPGLTAVG